MEFRSRLLAQLSRNSLTTKQIYELFPELNKSTISWHLYDELKRGNIIRTSHGAYEIASDIPAVDTRSKYASEKCLKAFSHLKTIGIPFYVTGLDCLNGVGMTVNGNYPVLLCADRKHAKDIQLELMREFDFSVTENELLNTEIGELKNRLTYIILESSDFGLQEAGFAFKEKAFVDIYYACTRLEYPLPKKELPHILSIIEPNGFRFRRATKDRGLSDELNFLLSYDKEFITSLSDYVNL